MSGCPLFLGSDARKWARIKRARLAEEGCDETDPATLCVKGPRSECRRKVGRRRSWQENGASNHRDPGRRMRDAGEEEKNQRRRHSLCGQPIWALMSGYAVEMDNSRGEKGECKETTWTVSKWLVMGECVRVDDAGWGCIRRPRLCPASRRGEQRLSWDSLNVSVGSPCQRCRRMAKRGQTRHTSTRETRHCENGMPGPVREPTPSRDSRQCVQTSRDEQRRAETHQQASES